MPVERVTFRLRPRWLAAGIAALLLPKCFLCVAGYVALAAGFAAGQPELCGGLAALSDGAAFAFAALGAVAGVGLLLYAGRRPASTRAGENPGSAKRP